MAKDISSFIERARQELTKITGLPVSSTIGASKDDRGWHVMVEMIEKKSVPDQMDILALYEVLLDEEGTVLSLERTSMRRRMETTIK